MRGERTATSASACARRARRRRAVVAAEFGGGGHTNAVGLHAAAAIRRRGPLRRRRPPDPRARARRSPLPARDCSARTCDGAPRRRQAGRPDVARRRRRVAPRASASAASATPARSTRSRPASCVLVIGRATRLSPFLTGGDKRTARRPLRLRDDHLRRRGQSTLAPPAPVHRRPRAPRARGAARAVSGTHRRRRRRTRPRRSTASVPTAGAARRSGRAGAGAGDGCRRWTLVAFDGDGRDVRPDVSAGFYVRSLAHDLGAALGCGATCRAAAHRQRRRSTSARGAAAPRCEAAGPAAAAPIDTLLPDWRPAVVTAAGVERCPSTGPSARAPTRLAGHAADAGSRPRPTCRADQPRQTAARSGSSTRPGGCSALASLAAELCIPSSFWLTLIGVWLKLAVASYGGLVRRRPRPRLWAVRGGHTWH